MTERSAPTPDDIQPVAHETRDRIASGIVALVIAAMEKVGLVWDVVRVSPAHQARKAASPA